MTSFDDPPISRSDSSRTSASRLRDSIGQALLRGIVWGLVGLIYAPLFAVLRILFYQLGLAGVAVVPAAALAGGVGAAFYGARQIPLLATLVGLAVGALCMQFVPTLTLFGLVGVTAISGFAVGLVVRFPERCSRHVPGKVLAGLVTGSICGSALAAVEPFHPTPFHTTGIVAFLVAVNGVLYVATVRKWVRLTTTRSSRICNVVEALVIACLAVLAAVALWIVAGPMIGIVDARYLPTLDAIQQEVPDAVIGGLIGGGVTGTLLQAFRFRWVHDL